MTRTFTLAFLEPGHFHAALTLKTSNARVDRNVHLYATPGAEREAFVALVKAFNTRDDNPTDWHVQVHESEAPRTKLVDDGHADVVILAGQNAAKLEHIAALHRAGIAVLADKPWLTDPAALADLHQVTSGVPLALDIMTERHDVMAGLRQRICTDDAILGGFATAHPEGAAIEIGSRHHLFKRVNGAPLRRPAWYYDVRVQGDGLVDIQSHMVDQMQWLVGGESNFDFESDVSGLTAKRWGTGVDAALFKDSTGHDAFPPTLVRAISNGVLDLQCNSVINYTLRGVPVQQQAQWGQREPEGSGDIHAARIRGQHAQLHLEHGPETDFLPRLHLLPATGSDAQSAAQAAVERWRADIPGLELRASRFGFEFFVPLASRTTHEQHFAMVLDEFLDLMENTQTGQPGSWPRAHAARIRMRYTLLAAACGLIDGATP